MLIHAKTHAEKFDPSKNIFDPRNPRKIYDPLKMLTHVKNILTHVTHATQVKIWPTHPRTHVTHVTTQPTRLSWLHNKM